MKLQSLDDLPETSKYLRRVNAESRSLLKAVVKEDKGNGYWLDIAIIRFEKNGEIHAPDGYQPLAAEIESIKEEFSALEWPSQVNINLEDSNLPQLYISALPEERFEFKDTSGNITMLQVKRIIKGQRTYIPITKWSDGEYRFVEPDNLLPLWGLEQLNDYTTVFIHEGCRAAKAGKDIADGLKPDHPWAQELSNAAHLAWIGGALSPHRTDWSILQKKGVTRAYIIADNDDVGRSAVPRISRELNCPTFMVQFDDNFKASFDLADDFPEVHFSEIEGKRYFVGPSFRQTLQPATYMTKLVTVPGEGDKKPKQVPVLRDHAKTQWLLAEETNLFVNAEFPDVIRDRETLDMMLVPFSDSRKTTELLISTFIGRTPRFAYDPTTTGRKLINNGVSAINLYTPSYIRAADGDPKPWIDYLTYLIPNPVERHEVMKWIATLVSRPDIRMMYALLLISEQTGTGKSTLGNILAKLVGEHNASFPTESSIMETFNAWIARKRLVVVQEIYAGSSWKAANKLKTYITDPKINMRMMYKDGVEIDNWAHFTACSNSFEALKLDMSDRRWYVPTLTEIRRSPQEWSHFFGWLEGGGYSIIAGWAQKFGEYVRTGDRSPSSARKTEMINDSYSHAGQEVMALCESVTYQKAEAAFAINAVIDWAVSKVKGQSYDKKRSLENIAIERGFTLLKDADRMVVIGRPQNILVSPDLMNRVASMERKEAREYIKSKIVNPSSFLEDSL